MCLMVIQGMEISLKGLRLHIFKCCELKHANSITLKKDVMFDTCLIPLVEQLFLMKLTDFLCTTLKIKESCTT